MNITNLPNDVVGYIFSEFLYGEINFWLLSAVCKLFKSCCYKIKLNQLAKLNSLNQLNPSNQLNQLDKQKRQEQLLNKITNDFTDTNLLTEKLFIYIKENSNNSIFNKIQNDLLGNLSDQFAHFIDFYDNNKQINNIYPYIIKNNKQGLKYIIKDLNLHSEILFKSLDTKELYDNTNLVKWFFDEIIDDYHYSCILLIKSAFYGKVDAFKKILKYFIDYNNGCSGFLNYNKYLADELFINSRKNHDVLSFLVIERYELDTHENVINEFITDKNSHIELLDYYVFGNKISVNECMINAVKNNNIKALRWLNKIDQLDYTFRDKTLKRYFLINAVKNKNLKAYNWLYETKKNKLELFDKLHEEATKIDNVINTEIINWICQEKNNYLSYPYNFIDQN
jgi:hypothetical protein